MISEQIQKQAVWYRGVPHYPINVCMHCGAEESPEDTRSWPEDKDGDRICYECAKASKCKRCEQRPPMTNEEFCESCRRVLDEQRREAKEKRGGLR